MWTIRMRLQTSLTASIKQNEWIKKKKYAPLNDEHMHAEHGQSLACWRNMVWQSTCDLRIRVFPYTAVIVWVLSM